MDLIQQNENVMFGKKIICTPTCELNQNYKTSPKVCVPKPALGTDDDLWHAKETTVCKEICFPAVTPPKFSEPFGPRDEHQASACSRRRAAKAGRWLLGTPAAPYVFFPYASMGKDRRIAARTGTGTVTFWH